MASAKLTLALAVVAVCAALAATTAAGHRPYPAPEIESCKTQAKYFTNCITLGYEERCCTGVVADKKCFCEVEREAEIPCVPHRSCPGNGAAAKAIRIAEMNLSCMKNLKCKRA